MTTKKIEKLPIYEHIDRTPITMHVYNELAEAHNKMADVLNSLTEEKNENKDFEFLLDMGSVKWKDVQNTNIDLIALEDARVILRNAVRDTAEKARQSERDKILEIIEQIEGLGRYNLSTVKSAITKN